MAALTLGPLMFPAGTLAILLGCATFLLTATVASVRVDAQLRDWAWIALTAGIVAARLGHVALNLPDYADPMRLFALGDGGFSWPFGALAVAATVLLILPTRRLRLWAVAPLVAGLVVWNTAWQLTSRVNATPLPGGVFATLDGGALNLSGAAGKPLVLNLWASWCPPCRREMPVLADVAAGTDSVGFLFADQGENAATVRAFLARQGLAPETVLLDPFSDLSRHYGAPGLPATLFIAADGRLVDVHLGEISRRTLLAKIARLTATDQASDQTLEISRKETTQDAR